MMTQLPDTGSTRFSVQRRPSLDAAIRAHKREMK